MPQFMQRPTEVTAEQYTGSAPMPVGVLFDDLHRAYVVTIHEQRVYLEAGDWILPERDGEHYYPVKDAIFVKTYDAKATPQPNRRLDVVATVLGVLQEACLLDLLGVHNLFEQCVAINEQLADHPTIQTKSYEDNHVVSVLGLINGLVETLSVANGEGPRRIAAIYNEAEELVGFQEYPRYLVEQETATERGKACDHKRPS